MKSTFASTALVALTLVLTNGENIYADATVVVQSSPLSNNLTSGGQPLDSSYTFQLGCFINSIDPATTSTDDWLVNWVPLSDEAGDPIPGATVPYDDTEISPGVYWNSFEISVPFTHNTPPFTTSTQFYIWGYDEREQDGQAEWILITDPSWIWPEATPGEPTQLTFTVASATVAVIGTLNTGAVEMQTAAVTVVTAQLPHYDQWLQTFFDQATLDDSEQMESVWGVLADPDNDEYSNLVEYYIGTSPTVGVSRPNFNAIIDEGIYVFSFDRITEPPGATGHVEWSTDLVNWDTIGLSETVVEGEEGEETVTNSIALPSNGRIFMRLYVERVLE